MGFWDKKVDNSFDRMFDMDRDGMLNPYERALQSEYLTKQSESSSMFMDFDDDDLDDLDDDDLEDLDLMDEDERRDALESAGYDPDDFDDDLF